MPDLRSGIVVLEEPEEPPQSDDALAAASRGDAELGIALPYDRTPDGRWAGCQQRPLGYTIGMKTAISVPTPVFHKAEKFARRLKKSRSQLYSEAVSEYVDRHDVDAITALVDALYRSQDSRTDAFAREAGRRVLRSKEW